MKNLVKSFANLLGYKIIGNEYFKKLRGNKNVSNMSNGLERLSLQINPETIIDVGSARGDWTNIALKFWPNSNYILVDPLTDKYIPLASTCLPNIKRIKKALGKTSGTAKFNVAEDLYGSGVADNNKLSDNTVEVEIESLESILGTTKKNRILLKLDTHGVETEIFEGIKESWISIEAIIVEVYGFYVLPGSNLFHEISGYLSLKGYRLYDIVDIMRRDKDQAFWQADAIYLKASHPIFKDNSFT